MHGIDVLSLSHSDSCVDATVVEFLAHTDFAIAPHVASVLCAQLAGDEAAAIEVAWALTPAQRAGHSALPDPLPLTPLVNTWIRHEGVTLTEVERGLLLAAAVCVEDRTELLLGTTDLSMADVIASQLGNHLRFVAGHFSFAEPRMRMWVHATASIAERTAAHQALDRSYESLGESGMATWHRSLARLEGDANLVPDLLELARQAQARGDSSWAYAVAREAASHATGAGAYPAQLLAGITALGGGLVTDALAWLERVLNADDLVAAARALPPYVHAETLLQGAVPEVVLGRQTARLLAAQRALDPADFTIVARQLAKASALAACLHASHGELKVAASHLAYAESLVRDHQLSGEGVCASRGWCAMFGVTESHGAVTINECCCGGCADGGINEARGEGTGHFDARVVVRALTLGLEDEPAAGLRILHAANDSSRVHTGGPGAAHHARGLAPLTVAYRAVAASLLHFWAGDLTRASRELHAAALEAPVGLPLAGLGITIARRLDVAREGKVSAVSHALGATHPSGGSAAIRTADLVDRALAAYLVGHIAESATLGDLAAERARRGEISTLHVPGFDEQARWPLCTSQPQQQAPDAATRVPAEHRLACAARRALITTDPRQFAVDYDFAVNLSWSLRSIYERARTEFVLGQVCTLYGDAALARHHLVVASGLFRESGAFAWLRSVERALAIVTVSDLSADTVPLWQVSTPTPAVPAQTGVEGRLSAAPGTETAPIPQIAAFTGPRSAERSAERGAEMRATAAMADESPLEVCRSEWALTLTERELEVALLVVEGAPNREVATKLFVSVRTVEVHLGRVFSKLGVRSRVELSVLAHRMGGGWRNVGT